MLWVLSVHNSSNILSMSVLTSIQSSGILSFSLFNFTYKVASCMRLSLVNKANFDCFDSPILVTTYRVNLYRDLMKQ